MKKQSLYQNLAKYYDLIYSERKYAKETKQLIKIIRATKKSKGKRLLEVACGTGLHLEHFKKHFSCSGIDINQGILNVAKKKMPKVAFKKANMINFKLNEKFDVITCLFSSIGYVKTYKNLEKTIKSFSSHLNQGGVLIIEPWFVKSQYKEGYPHMTTYGDQRIKIARLAVSKIKNNVSVIDMNYLIAEKDKPVRYFIDRHELGLFETKATLKLLKKAGINAMFITKGLTTERGLFVGVKN